MLPILAWALATAIPLAYVLRIDFDKFNSMTFSKLQNDWQMLIDLLYTMGYEPKQISEILDIYCQ